MQLLDPPVIALGVKRSERKADHVFHPSTAEGKIVWNYSCDSAHIFKTWSISTGTVCICLYLWHSVSDSSWHATFVCLT
jgi:hypothetical protein